MDLPKVPLPQRRTFGDCENRISCGQDTLSTAHTTGSKK